MVIAGAVRTRQAALVATSNALLARGETGILVMNPSLDDASKSRPFMAAERQKLV
jgi:hypothetical protein